MFGTDGFFLEEWQFLRSDQIIIFCCYDTRYQSKLSGTSINLTREGVLNMWWMRGSGWGRLALLIIQILIGNAYNRVTSLESQCILKIFETYAQRSYIWGFPLKPPSMPSEPKGQIFPRWVVPWFSWPIRCIMTKDKSWNSLLKRTNLLRHSKQYALYFM